MYKARRHLDKKSLLNLYYSYIYPYLTYCIEVWGCAAKSHLQALFILQKKIVRIMTRVEFLPEEMTFFRTGGRRWKKLISSISSAEDLEESGRFGRKWNKWNITNI